MPSESSIKTEVQVTLETPGMNFPMELQKEQMIVDFLPDSCGECKPGRERTARELAAWGRVGVAKAVILVEERLPCDHLED